MIYRQERFANKNFDRETATKVLSNAQKKLEELSEQRSSPGLFQVGNKKKKDKQKAPVKRELTREFKS